jgi:hypothetical protein
VQATGGHPVETVNCCAAISRQNTADHENAAKSTQSKPQRKLDHPFIRHAESRPVGIVRPMVAHEEKGRDTSPAVTLRLPRTEPRAFQLLPPLATQQQLAQMGRGERLRYSIDLADRENAARAVGTTIRTTNQPLNPGNPRNNSGNYQLPTPLRGPRHPTRPAFTAANVTHAIASLNLRDEENRPTNPQHQFVSSRRNDDTNGQGAAVTRQTRTEFWNDTTDDSDDDRLMGFDL